MRLNLDVLTILDAIERHGTFAAAAESLHKTPSALSYMVQKLESDLDISLLDRSGHRAKFTDTGRMMLEKGRLILAAARSLEKQAVQLSAGWEKELVIALDGSFPFQLLLPLVEEFYALNQQTQLQFRHHTLAGSWEDLTHNDADIILGAINEPPTSLAYSYKMLNTLENVFVIAPNHPLAPEFGPLDNDLICRYRSVVISDSAKHCPRINSNMVEEQEKIYVSDFYFKIQVLIAGLACGFLPRHIAQPFIERGVLIQKEVVSFREQDVAYIAWRKGDDGLASRWWREQILNPDFIDTLYTPSRNVQTQRTELLKKIPA